MSEKLIGLVAVVVLSALVPAACGDSGLQEEPAGDDAPPAPTSRATLTEEESLDDYYWQVNAVVSEATQQLDQVEQANAEGVARFFNQGVDLENMDDAPAAEVADLAATTFRGRAAVFDSLNSRMTELQAPRELDILHREYIGAGEEIREALGDIINFVESVDSNDEYNNPPERLGVAINDARERFEDACYALQEVATDNAIDAYLDCGAFELVL